MSKEKKVVVEMDNSNSSVPKYVKILGLIPLGMLLSTIGFLWWLVIFQVTPAIWNLYTFMALFWLTLFSTFGFIFIYLYFLLKALPPEEEVKTNNLSSTDLSSALGFLIVIILGTITLGPLGLFLIIVLFALFTRNGPSSTKKDRIHQVIVRHHGESLIPLTTFVNETALDPQTISSVLSSIILNQELAGSLDQEGYHPKPSI